LTSAQLGVLFVRMKYPSEQEIHDEVLRRMKAAVAGYKKELAALRVAIRRVKAKRTKAV
jgi:hypothetical protein